jgi:hypothetical protein
MRDNFSRDHTFTKRRNIPMCARSDHHPWSLVKCKHVVRILITLAAIFAVISEILQTRVLVVRTFLVRIVVVLVVMHVILTLHVVVLLVMDLMVEDKVTTTWFVTHVASLATSAASVFTRKIGPLVIPVLQHPRLLGKAQKTDLGQL